MWRFGFTNRAEKQLKNYRHSAEYKLFENAMNRLNQEEDPTRLGEVKILGELYCYSFRVTRSLRLLYTVDREKRLIMIHRLGDHKESYDRDK
jgi:mRNA-degrading endonuclease RelE of RelBE toxin-antitoxin system